MHKFPKLTSLALGYLDLAGEHSLLYRAVAFHSIQNLRLVQLRRCKSSQLIRFINYFRFLITLQVQEYKFDTLEYHGQSLPKAFCLSTRSLTTLDLELIPGVSKLIHWTLKAGQFLKNLKKLTLACENCRDVKRLRLAFAGVESLLGCCSSTVEELTLRFLNIVMADEISDICKFTRCTTISTNPSDSPSLAVRLDSFTKLHRLVYDGEMYRKSSIFAYAARQLSTQSSSTNISELCIKGMEPDKGLAEVIDKSLTIDMFPRLRTVEIFHDAPSPNLERSGMLIRSRTGMVLSA